MAAQSQREIHGPDFSAVWWITPTEDIWFSRCLTLRRRHPCSMDGHTGACGRHARVMASHARAASSRSGPHKPGTQAAVRRQTRAGTCRHWPLMWRHHAPDVLARLPGSRTHTRCLTLLDALHPDVVTLQECRRPSRLDRTVVWHGPTETQGVAVACRTSTPAAFPRASLNRSRPRHVDGFSKVSSALTVVSPIRGLPPWRCRVAERGTNRCSFAQ